MSISIFWKLVRDDGHSVHGLSRDWTTYQEVFGHRHLSWKDIPMLSAMHRATGSDKSLWGDLADALEGLPDGTSIEVYAVW